MHRILLALLLGLVAPPVFAWSGFGHRLVAELAERQLSPATRDAVHALLIDEGGTDLASIASWADTVRDLPEYEWSSPLHYVNIQSRDCRYDATRDCDAGGCVVAAVARYRQRLADTALPRAARIEALKFLVHFIGDVHQPLHAGRRADKGGNDFQINLRRPGQPDEGTNLHSVWDYFVLAGAGRSLDEYADALEAQPLPATRGDPVAWAEASCALTDSDGFYPRRPGTLRAGYLDAMRPLAETRIRAAAAELANAIESALASTAVDADADAPR